MSDLTRKPIFHLAIPCDDLDKAEYFYVQILGCEEGRRHSEHVIFEFFGHQLVCHYSPGEVVEEPEMYPRHLGIIFEQEQNYDQTLSRLIASEVDFYREPFVRLEGEPGEHRTFFVSDPSNNLIEFKYYTDSQDIY